MEFYLHDDFSVSNYSPVRSERFFNFKRHPENLFSRFEVRSFQPFVMSEVRELQNVKQSLMVDL